MKHNYFFQKKALITVLSILLIVPVYAQFTFGEGGTLPVFF